MTHLWMRAESRPNESRAPLTPEGTAALAAQGVRVTVETSPQRSIPVEDYRVAGAALVDEGGWRDAPGDALILGLKELPDDGTPLVHRHIMFGHAYKGQSDGQRLLARFVAGGGALLDLEYLTNGDGRRVAAFGYWAGYAGAAVSLLARVAQSRGRLCAPISVHADAASMEAGVAAALAEAALLPDVLVIGARGRVGRGAVAFCRGQGLAVSEWDKGETAGGGPFPEVLAHELFLNCILAAPGTPVFVPASATRDPRKLRVIGDIACDPGSEFSPIKVYDRVTDWQAPARRVHDAPPLDVMAVDNLPALLPREASADFASQLLPHLATLEHDPEGVWQRAAEMFHRHAPQG